MPNRTVQRTAPDALDLALNLGGVFDGDLGSVLEGDWQNEAEVTARASEHVPSPNTADDADAPAPEDLGRSWLEHATESERSLGFADTLPDLEKLPGSSDESSEPPDAEDDDDETTVKYVRHH